MPQIRTGRRKYYDMFSHLYDAFIKLHARRDEGATRDFLVEMSDLKDIPKPSILDICCGTGAVILAFANRYEESLTVGYDFSHGMLRKAREKPGAQRVRFIEGDAAALPFADECFDMITCSHALYEMKGEARQVALREMERVIKPAGMVLIMEHEVPRHPFVRMLFNLRMMAMGSADAREFVTEGLETYKGIFPRVSLTHSTSGKSKLIICRK
ncbi:MAG: methyltransferase domain-containing protein [Deltaproteobacteria bacterium]|nr:methyltransferase domain-containing protein [Deltaproteobacteria bacterium]